MQDYYIHQLNPYLWEFGNGWGIRYYGMAYVLGFVAYYLGLQYFYKKGWSPVPPARVDVLLIYIVLGVLIGGRLGYALVYDWQATLYNPLGLIAFWQGGGISGMSSHGGIAGAVLALWLFCWREGFAFWRVLDCTAILAPIGIFLGRIANFINGELWGRPSTVPWAVVFPQAPLVEGQAVARHPSQLYEALGEGLFLFLILYGLMYVSQRARWVRWRAGYISAFFLILYSIARISVEFFREADPHMGYYLGGYVTMGQILSLLPLLLGAGLLAYWHWRGTPSSLQNKRY